MNRILRPNALKRLGSLTCILSAGFGSSAAIGQSSLSAITNPIPPTYDQNRNVSVLETPRPDYDALGIRLGSVVAYPSLGVSVAESNNVYATPQQKNADTFLIVAPAVTAVTNWSRHQIRISGTGAFRRYTSETLLNRDEWDLRSLGRLDIGDSANVTVEGQIARLREEPFTSQLDAPVATLSSYRREFMSLRGQREVGHVRVIGSADLTSYRFSELRFSDGQSQSQRDRDRDIATVAGQVEYALAPGAVVFGQASYSHSNYRSPQLLTGASNRDSDSWRAIGGMNFDLTAFVRGTVGLGYSRRNYKSLIYGSVSGLSIETEITYFISKQTNFRFQAHRIIDDSALNNNSAYFDSIVSVAVDHELRRNVLVSAMATYNNQNYIDSALGYDIFRLDGNIQYLMNRRTRMRFDLGYAKRDRSGLATSLNIDEATGRVTFALQI